jgi:hypothetical protein
MAEFVRRQKIRLYVLSPKSPKLNGAVERCNPAWRYEIYSVAPAQHLAELKAKDTSLPQRCT